MKEARHKRTNIVQLPLHNLSRRGQFREIEGTFDLTKGSGRGGMESYCFNAAEFLLGVMKIAVPGEC